jgi:hypothetical protein
VESAPAEEVDAGPERAEHKPNIGGRGDRISELELRVAELERELVALKDILDTQDLP